jgi:ABC-type nitrate/sulfonate/bicarbonate transport system ATPase subunit
MATGPRLSVDIGDKRHPGQGDALFSDLRLAVEPGTTLALVGPSGVGKSTLLRMIGGIDTDFTGSLTIDGVAAASTPAAGYVFQDPRLLPWLTAERNLTELGVPLEAARSALARVGLAADAAAYPHQLSGGMQRRVALARALASNPRLLLLDEPFVSLDRELVVEMQTLVRDLIAETGATAILVTHMPEDAARLADRAILLAGRPAAIAADLGFDIAPARRNAVDVAHYVEMLSSRS